MNNNNNKPAKSLRELAVDLDEICSIISELCDQLQGGGIMQARDIEPPLSTALPKLRRAVATLEAAAGGDNGRGVGEITAPGQSPLLM